MSARCASSTPGRVQTTQTGTARTTTPTGRTRTKTCGRTLRNAWRGPRNTLNGAAARMACPSSLSTCRLQRGRGTRRSSGKSSWRKREAACVFSSQRCGIGRTSDAEGASSEIAAPGGSASGGFLEGARLLLSQAGRNVTEAFGALREAGKLNGNAELLDILLGAGPSSKGLTVDPATIQRLEHCAWASNNPMCRLALGYRYHAGLGVEPSCAKAAVHWRLAADETMALNRLDGGVFPLHEVRLSQATEVRRQERKDAAIEMKREQATLRRLPPRATRWGSTTSDRCFSTASGGMKRTRRWRSNPLREALLWSIPTGCTTSLSASCTARVRPRTTQQRSHGYTRPRDTTTLPRTKCSRIGPLSPPRD
ncbi:hypothetical protein T484DRAFT_1887198, partial [Baffinella frigidus]